jgi:hypothetical protein
MKSLLFFVVDNPSLANGLGLRLPFQLSFILRMLVIFLECFLISPEATLPHALPSVAEGNEPR